MPPPQNSRAPLPPLPAPRKHLSQHFLRDPRVIARIIDAVGSGGHILEIGPGRGALTDALVQTAAQLTVVELDRDLAARLAQRYPPDRLRVIQGDILAFDLRAARGDSANSNSNSGSGAADARLRLVGNLPYRITTPLIFHLLAQVEHIADMFFMVQREVAARLCARAGDTNYGRLSVMTAYALDVQALFTVPPTAFLPPPKVYSTVLRLTPKSAPLRPRNPKMLEQIVRAAFQQRRKTLRNALGKLVQPHQFDRAGIAPNLRPQQLTPQQYIALSDALAADHSAPE